MPPLHIKPSFIKQCVTALDKVLAAFKCLQDFLRFPKLKSGVKDEKDPGVEDFPEKGLTRRDKNDLNQLYLSSWAT